MISTCRKFPNHTFFRNNLQERFVLLFHFSYLTKKYSMSKKLSNYIDNNYLFMWKFIKI